MKNKNKAYILIALYLVLAISACTNGSSALTSIAVTGQTLFFEGDEFDGSCLTVTATYEDGSSRAVTGYSVSGFSTESINMGQEMTISYTENLITKTAQVTYYVAADGARPTEVPVSLSNEVHIFGDFPQSVVHYDATTTYTQEPVYKGWYLGSDGYLYAKCTVDAYSTEYKYSDGKTNVGHGSIKYFKVEPIKWRVLGSSKRGNRILLAEKILTASIRFYTSEEERTINSVTISPNNYEHSNIRAYLNGISYQKGTTTDDTWENNGFLQLAFTPKAQGLILTTEVDNGAASTNPASNSSLWNYGRNEFACGNTKDKIFLLSEEEATTGGYGFATYEAYGSGNSRIRKTTDYALANYAQQSSTAGYGGWWWLRSPHYYLSNNARCISVGGLANFNYRVDYRGGGVVPALSISANSLQ